MNSLVRSLVAVAVVLGVSAALPKQEVPPSAVPSQVQRAAEMSAAATAWLDALSPDLRAKAQLPFDSDERRSWGYVGRTSGGVALGELTGEQRVSLDALLRAALSPEGYMKAHGVITLEELLGRDPGLYFATVFGHPESAEPWGWRLEGHHLSLNFTIRNKKFVTATPLFFGAEPAEVRDGVHAGFKMFFEEERRARDMVAELGGLASKSAVKEEVPPDDVVRGPGTEAAFARGEIEGVSIGKLDAPKQTRMMQLLGTFTDTLHQGLALPMMNRYRAKSLNDIGFLWVEKPDESDGLYLRFSSSDKEFTVEYLNRGNHVHCLVRDAADDFGDRRIEEWKSW